MDRKEMIERVKKLIDEFDKDCEYSDEEAEETAEKIIDMLF